MDNVGKEISVGNAAKIAAQLTSIAYENGADAATVFECWAGLHGAVAEHLLTTTEQFVPEAPVTTVFGQTAPAAPAAPAAPFNPEAALQAAFPGSVMQTTPSVVAPPAAPGNVVQFPSGAPVPQPAPIPGASTGGGDPELAAAWDLFFQDIQTGQWANNWIDNRATKKGANSPDFKHRTLKQASNPKYNVTLYIDGRKNPADVKARLAAVGIA